ncbi:response regulator transcription factor [Thiohalocapsa marina]|uniref:Response regulator transcription factor n=1 Tax=Thiohalocapsa marina TaxID=424902 RepID=A0A5M8FN33_9GAMM|nr:response regulator transcription factor [Thiohalocapsa marina]KAA6185106.1 response regulator transcription factor [Thiohalocapsa marina]
MATSLHIALVEDHDALRLVTADILAQAGHRVTALGCAEELDELAFADGVIDLFILDLNLPGEDGISLSQRLRQTHPSVGIIMLTARNADEQMAQGYASGADIYLAKPQAPETLLAAVASLARRLKPTPLPHSGSIDTASSSLHGRKGQVALHPIELTLLTAFLRAPDQRLDNWQLAEIISGSTEGASKAAIEVRLSRLRKKMRDCGAVEGADGGIHVLRGQGYQLHAVLKVS